jgi:hypothetical protein
MLKERWQNSFHFQIFPIRYLIDTPSISNKKTTLKKLYQEHLFKYSIQQVLHETSKLLTRKTCFRRSVHLLKIFDFFPKKNLNFTSDFFKWKIDFISGQSSPLKYPKCVIILIKNRKKNSPVSFIIFSSSVRKVKGLVPAGAPEQNVREFLITVLTAFHPKIWNLIKNSLKIYLKAKIWIFTVLIKRFIFLFYRYRDEPTKNKKLLMKWNSRLNTMKFLNKLSCFSGF